jgi:hypothetical protein
MADVLNEWRDIIMKGAVVGDDLLPTEILEKIFTGEEIETVVDSSVKTEISTKRRAGIFR